MPIEENGSGSTSGADTASPAGSAAPSTTGNVQRDVAVGSGPAVSTSQNTPHLSFRR